MDTVIHVRDSGTGVVPGQHNNLIAILSEVYMYTQSDYIHIFLISRLQTMDITTQI